MTELKDLTKKRPFHIYTYNDIKNGKQSVIISGNDDQQVSLSINDTCDIIDELEYIIRLARHSQSKQKEELPDLTPSAQEDKTNAKKVTATVESVQSLYRRTEKRVLISLVDNFGFYLTVEKARILANDIVAAIEIAATYNREHTEVETIE